MQVVVGGIDGKGMRGKERCISAGKLAIDVGESNALSGSTYCTWRLMFVVGRNMVMRGVCTCERAIQIILTFPSH
jgi:hypothetical protein